MRKKTALQTPQQRDTSLRKQGGLIVRGENAQESAAAKSTLTNRSHRTRIRLLGFSLQTGIPRNLKSTNR